MWLMEEMKARNITVIFKNNNMNRQVMSYVELITDGQPSEFNNNNNNNNT